MIYAVFLCDTKWKIERIRQCREELPLQEQDYLTDLVEESGKLKNNTEDHYSLELTFTGQKFTIPAIIDSFREGNLVILARVRDDREFLELNNAYAVHLEWAKDYLLGLYHNEYFLIQQMNNQLVDAQRKLTRSNRQLECALKENEEINKQLEEARILAERANVSKTRFLANMSHDIRTPMNAIVGLTELIQHHYNEPEILKNYISKLRFSGKYLLDLINDILDLSKIENGSVELKIDPMDIGAQIEQVVTIIRPQINKKRQILSIQSDCKEFGYLLGDAVRFRQILMNLFSNAMKYTPEGGKIIFSIHKMGEEENIQKYQFVIEDNGIGMTPEFAEHIFDPFTRAESVTGEIQGTGLGMAITKSIVNAMGGTIRVESTPGKGSRFWVDLSFKRCQDEKIPDTEKEALTGGDSEKQVSLKGMKFLCAEDNALNAEILTAMLKLEGAECMVYENGKMLADAFEQVQPGEYDAILMDIQMPVMNGYEATKKIRDSRNPIGKKIPIIAMTANAFAEDKQNALAAGMDGHLAKPVEMKRLIETLSEVIEK